MEVYLMEPDWTFGAVAPSEGVSAAPSGVVGLRPAIDYGFELEQSSRGRRMDLVVRLEENGAIALTFRTR
jgi:hypothetical protein